MNQYLVVASVIGSIEIVGRELSSSLELQD